MHGGKLNFDRQLQGKCLNSYTIAWDFIRIFISSIIHLNWDFEIYLCYSMWKEQKKLNSILGVKIEILLNYNLYCFNNYINMNKIWMKLNFALCLEITSGRKSGKQLSTKIVEDYNEKCPLEKNLLVINAHLYYVSKIWL